MSNFSFLEKEWVEIYNDCKEAERNLHISPNISLYKIGAMAEKMVSYICASSNIVLPKYDDSQEKKVKELETSKIIELEQCQIFHAIRKARNLAVHVNKNDFESASNMLRHAHKLCIWFHLRFSVDKVLVSNYIEPKVEYEYANSTFFLNQQKKKYKRSYYAAQIEDFLHHDSNFILGEIAKNNQFELSQEQRNVWIEEISILKNSLTEMNTGTIILEYTIPRIGSRVDVVLIVSGVIYLIEFKQGENYSKAAIDQVLDYALDLKNFHLESRNKHIVPIVCSVNANYHNNLIKLYEDDIANPILCNKNSLRNELYNLFNKFEFSKIDEELWINSPYMPTPTIIESAQALYNNHNVRDIN